MCGFEIREYMSVKWEQHQPLEYQFIYQLSVSISSKKKMFIYLRINEKWKMFKSIKTNKKKRKCNGAFLQELILIS